MASDIGLPNSLQFWSDDTEFVGLGHGVCIKRVAFINIKTYAIALFIERDAALAELAAQQACGAFDDKPESTVCNALLNSSFRKVAMIQPVRNITVSQFLGGIGEHLKPRLQALGGGEQLPVFEGYLAQQSFATGTRIPVMATGAGELAGGVFAPGTVDFSKPELEFSSKPFCTALFDMWLGDGSIAPDARKAWAASVLELLPAGNAQ